MSLCNFLNDIMLAGHYEKLPYNEKDIRSIYHVREFDFYKLMQLEEPIDIFMSHDWPLGVTSCGDLQNLLRRKPFFEQEVKQVTILIINNFLLPTEVITIYFLELLLFCNYWVTLFYFFIFNS